MAINPATAFPGAITAPDSNYPFGSVLDASPSTANNGTPINKIYGNDIWGLLQALLVATEQLPNGTADNVQTSQYSQAIINFVACGNFFQDDSVAANTFILNPISPFPGPAGYQDGMKIRFRAKYTTTSQTRSINVNSLGSISLSFTTILTAGEMVEVLYDKTSNSFSDHVASSGIPPGVILLWSGSSATTPNGWTICDGTNGTPDLRNHFVKGASVASPPSTTGGNSTQTPTITVNDHSLTVSEMPSHNHNISLYHPNLVGGSYTAGQSQSSQVSTASSTYSGSNQGHSHTASSTVMDINPTFYSLYYIMKL